jgi:hypothetical protein
VFKSVSRILAASLLAAPVTALAAPITVDFTVTATNAFDGGSNFNATSYNGFTAGALGSGSFTFDDSIGNYSSFTDGIVPIDLTFSWLGLTFTEANTQIWSLQFDVAGALFGWQIGALPCLNCLSTPGPTDFFASGYTPYAPYNNAVAHQEGVNGWMNGSVAWTARPASVPEPGTLGLLGLGLLGAAAARRKRAA